MIDKINLINEGLGKKYPHGINPFKMITRLAEECGELAKEVNHFEGEGSKKLKHGEPNKMNLAKEAQDVIRAVLQIVNYYSAEKEFMVSVDKSLKQLKEDGFIEK